MASPGQHYVGGNVYLREGARTSTWYARWHDANGEHRKKLGGHWTGKGKPPVGYLREREAKEALEEILVKARAGNASQARTGVTFNDAAEEWLRDGEGQRALKPTTIVDYRSALRAHLLPAFGDLRLEAVTPTLI
jgi:hypothetical protein